MIRCIIADTPWLCKPKQHLRVHSFMHAFRGSHVKEESGRGERIRTSGLYVPNVALYQAKLHPDGPATGLASRPVSSERAVHRPNTQF